MTGRRRPLRTAISAMFAVAMVAALNVPGGERAVADEDVSARPQLMVRLRVASVAADSSLNAAVSAAGADGCPRLIFEALGRAGCMIAFCESGWNAGATGPGGTMGWFQIHPEFHDDATHDPAGNVAAAVRISRGGTDWSAWGAASVLETGVCPGGVPYPW